MREMSMGQLFPKLKQPGFTTFRFPRKDREWRVGGMAKVVYKAQSPERSPLGVCQIVAVYKRTVTENSKGLSNDYGNPDIASLITEDEAVEDGFPSVGHMCDYLAKDCAAMVPVIVTMNKIILVWAQRWYYHPKQKPRIAKSWAGFMEQENTGEHYEIRADIMEQIHDQAASDAVLSACRKESQL